MRDYGRVFSNFWTGDMSTSSDDGKLLAVYLLSCEHGTVAGVCRLTDGYVSDDLHWQPERVAAGFDELSRKGFATRCATTNWVWVIGFLEKVAYNANQWTAARKIAASVPANCSWRAAFFEEFAKADPLEKLEVSETVAKGSPKGSGTVPLGSLSGTGTGDGSGTGSAQVNGSGSDASSNALRSELPKVPDSPTPHLAKPEPTDAVMRAKIVRARSMYPPGAVGADVLAKASGLPVEQVRRLMP